MPLPEYQSSNWNNKKRHNEIQQIAYALWQQAGRPSGRDLEFWLAAESGWERRNAPWYNSNKN